MKKYIITFCLLLAAITTLWAQSPNVSINVDTITTTSYTVSFHPDTTCSQYYIYSDVPGGMDMWLFFMGSVENIISAWGIPSTGDTTHTWSGMEPNTDYVIYVLATNADTSIIYTDTIRTATAGGSGASVITVSVDNITQTSAVTTAVPNDQTLLFKDFVIEKTAFDTMPYDTIVSWLKDQPYVYYETDIWNWLSLSPSTDYYFCAIGMNADSVWGNMSQVQFRTLGSAAEAPAVDITVDTITTTSYTVSFQPNNTCTQYYIYSDVPGGMDMWLFFMGSVENIISAWGIPCTGDTTHTWSGMEPNTDYVIYVLATNADTSIIYTDTIRTATAGGSGASVITVSVDNITQTSAVTTAVPNDQTLLFKDFVIEKTAFDTMPYDTIVSWLKDQPYVYYETDTWNWLTLSPATDYYFCAIGMNADSVWGDMAQVQFRTLGGAAEAPAVDITVDSVATTSFTVSFQPNNTCSQYYILADIPGGLDQWLPFFGSYENMIVSWGISCTGDTTYTWNEMIPGSEYVVYALATNADTAIIYTTNLVTLQTGDHGTSVITVSVDGITQTSAVTTAVPNDQTFLFKDFIIEKTVFDSLPFDTVVSWLKSTEYTLYETDVWNWLSLSPNTEYYFCAMGMNIDSVWGDMSKVMFRTLSNSSIAQTDGANITLYPNPATNQINIDGLNAQGRVIMYDLQGRQIMNATTPDGSITLDVVDLARGSYLLQIFSSAATAPTVRSIVLQ